MVIDLVYLCVEIFAPEDFQRMIIRISVKR